MVYFTGGTVIKIVIDSELFFSIIRKFFYIRLLMTVGGGEAARTNLGDVSTKNPFFSITSPSIGGAKVLSMTNLAKFQPRTQISPVRVYLWSMRDFFRWGLSLTGPPTGPRRELQLIFNSYTPWQDHL